MLFGDVLGSISDLLGLRLPLPHKVDRHKSPTDPRTSADNSSSPLETYQHLPVGP